MPASRKPDDLAPLWIAAGAMLLLVIAGVVMLQRPVSREIAALQPRSSRTPYPTETPRPTRTRTPTITPTLKETFSPGSAVQTVAALPRLVLSTPDPARDYQLTAWTEDDAFRMVLELDARRESSADNAKLVGEQFATITMLHEMSLRYPETAEATGSYAEMGRRNGRSEPGALYGYTHVLIFEPIRDGLEKALNAGRAAYGGEKAWVERHGFTLSDAQDAPNLFDDGQNARILSLALTDGSGARLTRLFAVRSLPGGGFQVMGVSPAWSNQQIDVSAAAVLDVDGNGAPEIVRTAAWKSVDFSTCSRRMWIYAWNGARFTERTPDPIEIKIDGDFPGECREFGYQGIPGGSYQIVAEKVIRSACSDPAFDLTVRDVYQYDGSVYRRIQSETSAPPPAEPLFCAVDWARKAGPKNPRALAIIEQALQSWPARAVTDWGPLSKDFYMLRLALWQVQLGREEDAAGLMRMLSEMPETAPGDLPVQTGQAFLEAYNSTGMYQAILASKAVFEEAVQKALSEGAQVPLGFEECCSNYGVPFPYRQFFDFDPLAVTLGRAGVTTTQELSAWLAKNGVPATAVIDADLNGDGQTDWLVLTGDDQLAVLTQNSAEQGPGLQVLRLPEAAPKSMTLTAYEPVPGAPWIAVGQAGGDLYAFHVENSEIVYDIRWMESEYRNSGMALEGDFTIDRAEGGNTLVVTFNGGLAEYTWNYALNRLSPSATAPDVQEDRVTAAEIALFNLQDYAQAETMLFRLLEGAIYEQAQVDSMAYDQPRPGFLRSHVGYLYALALELQGKEAEAAKAYTELWQYFPDSAYALVARRKLGE